MIYPGNSPVHDETPQSMVEVDSKLQISYMFLMIL
jgi:hypothetical protein